MGMVLRITSSIFVGRGLERARLEESVGGAGRGEPGLVLIGGEAGIGKSRLVGELEAMAGERGFLTARGFGVEAVNGSLPYAPFVEILRQIHSEAPQAFVALDDVSRSEMARIMPQLDGLQAVGSSTGDDSPLRLYHAVHDLLALVATERALLLIVEDVHWADSSSLELLRFLAARFGSQRLLAIATFRSDEVRGSDSLQRFLAEAPRLPTVERMELPALSRLEVADQMAGILGRRPPEPLVDRISERSDGNPFFVEELLAAGDGDSADRATLHEVLARRMVGLTRDAHAMIQVAAALGREFDHSLLARVARLPDERLLKGLREAVDHHLLVTSVRAPGSTFAFRHALVQELAYAQLLPPERVALHSSIARVLEDAHGSAAEVAHHAYRAQDLPTALARSLDAADDAVAALAFPDALAHLERSLEIWHAVPDPEVQTGRKHSVVLMLAARCATASGLPQRARDLARQALDELDPVSELEARAVVLLDLYFLEADAGDPAGRDAATIEAAELVPRSPPSPLLARVLINMAGTHEMNGRAEDAQRLAEEALQVARAAHAPQEEAEALLRLADIVGGMFGQAETAVAYLDRVEEILAGQPDPPRRLLSRLWWLRAWRQALAGRFEEALETADLAMAAAAKAGVLRQDEDAIREVRISVLADLGRWTEVEALVDEARRAGPTAYHRVLEVYAPVLIRTGRLSEAAEALEAGRPDEPDPIGDPLAMEPVILLANAERRWEDARRATDSVVAAVPDPVHDVGLWFTLAAAIEGEADRAELARQRRRSAEAEKAREIGGQRLALLERGLGAAVARGAAGQRAEALLATARAEASRLEGRSQASLWEEAAARRDRLGRSWEGAYAGFRHAEALLRTRASKAAAAVPLRRSHSVAEKLGAAPLRDQIEQLALRSRITLGTAPAATAKRAVTEDGVVVSLTGREREVLSLVAAGHTNREIGAELFISEKTASVHITNAMDKLGALSRYDAAARASRLGLLGYVTGSRDTTPRAGN